MEFFDVLQKRHSYRKAFTAEPVSDSDIKKIIEAGILAPSGMNAQTTSFVVVTDEKLKKEIASVLSTDAVKTAPVIIAVLTEHVITPCGMAFEIEDYSAAVENMLLAAAALGYATVWMDGMTKREKTSAEIGRILNIPEGKCVRTILPVGVPQEKVTQPPRKAFEERCHYNSF